MWWATVPSAVLLILRFAQALHHTHQRQRWCSNPRPMLCDGACRVSIDNSLRPLDILDIKSRRWARASDQLMPSLSSRRRQPGAALQASASTSSRRSEGASAALQRCMPISQPLPENPTPPAQSVPASPSADIPHGISHMGAWFLEVRFPSQQAPPPPSPMPMPPPCPNDSDPLGPLQLGFHFEARLAFPPLAGTWQALASGSLQGRPMAQSRNISPG